MGEPSHSSDRVTLLPCEMTRQNLADNPNAKLRMLYIASAFCVICMIIKIVGGWLAHSLVIASGAFHLLSVVCALLISIVAICKTQRQPTDDQSFGYHRAEVCAICVLSPLHPWPPSNYFLFQVLGDFASIIVIWFVTGIIIYLAVKRLLQGDIKIDSNIMMITGIVGAVANGL